MTATSTGMTRMESFPFDSKADGYDADGYPVYDRAVGASMLRSTFGKFFSNGIFPSPGDALQIGKGTSGLTVTIQPGIAIIDGAMGGVEGDDPITLTLDTVAPQGNVCYGIMLRYDNTDERRSLYFNVVKGDASSTPQPPAPDTTTPEVHEMRLGYVTVPSNSTDLSEATVTNEKGLEVCPFAAPFEEIDMATVIADAQASAQEYLSEFESNVESAYENFDSLLQNNLDLIESAIDGTTAGYLQNQINELKESADIDSDTVDNVTIEYSPITGSAGVSKLHIKNEGVGTNHLAASSVTEEKIGTGAVTDEKIQQGGFNAGALSSDAVSDGLEIDKSGRVRVGSLTDSQLPPADDLLSYLGFPVESNPIIQARLAGRTWLETNATQYTTSSITNGQYHSCSSISTGVCGSDFLEEYYGSFPQTKYMADWNAAAGVGMFFWREFIYSSSTYKTRSVVRKVTSDGVASMLYSSAQADISVNNSYAARLPYIQKVTVNDDASATVRGTYISNQSNSAIKSFNISVSSDGAITDFYDANALTSYTLSASSSYDMPVMLTKHNGEIIGLMRTSSGYLRVNISSDGVASASSNIFTVDSNYNGVLAEDPSDESKLIYYASQTNSVSLNKYDDSVSGTTLTNVYDGTAYFIPTNSRTNVQTQNYVSGDGNREICQIGSTMRKTEIVGVEGTNLKLKTYTALKNMNSSSVNSPTIYGEGSESACMPLHIDNKIVLFTLQDPGYIDMSEMSQMILSGSYSVPSLSVNDSFQSSSGHKTYGPSPLCVVDEENGYAYVMYVGCSYHGSYDKFYLNTSCTKIKIPE